VGRLAMAAAFPLDHIMLVTGSPRADNRVDNTAGLSALLMCPAELVNSRSGPSAGIAASARGTFGA
jgi:hypothetical protein